MVMVHQWVTVDDAHLNENHIIGFKWSDGKLLVYLSDSSDIIRADPDGKLYKKLCAETGQNLSEKAEQALKEREQE